MTRNPQLFNITLAGDMYNRYFEAILGYWLTNANQSVTSSDYKTYGGLLGGSMDPTDPSTEPNYQGEAVYAYEERPFCSRKQFNNCRTENAKHMAK